MAKEKRPKQPLPPLKVWLLPVLTGWLIPGGGHFLLGRRIRAALLCFAVLGMFLFGLMMRGVMFKGQSGDILTIIINWGGYFANMATGLPYFLANWLGYSEIDAAGHVRDYGTKFLAGAGLLNVLSMIDAFEIAAGRKS